MFLFGQIRIFVLHFLGNVTVNNAFTAKNENSLYFRGYPYSITKSLSMLGLI